MCDEPGSQTIPMAKQALAQKRNVRDLNTRLEMFVRAQAEKTRTINQLKDSLARQELEAKGKLAQERQQYQAALKKLRKENEHLEYENKCTRQDFSNALAAKKEYEGRLTQSEEKNASLISDQTNLKAEVARYVEQLDKLRKQHAALKYKYDSYESERNSFEQLMSKHKAKQDQLLRQLTQAEANLKSDKQTFDRLIVEKNDELEQFRTQLKQKEEEVNTIQPRLRQEFDSKLAEYIQKREEQYRQEKDEWMRIFKEEFNRKLRSFKEANQELSHSNIKQSEEMKELRTRMCVLKQKKTELELMMRKKEEEVEKMHNDLDDLRRTKDAEIKMKKTELEVVARNHEEEMDKLRNDLDDLRRNKDSEIKIKNQLIIQERDRFKAKELQFNELAGIKLQLDAEIELYRNILNEAEQECGYTSPLAAKGTNGRASRKRKRLNTYGTPGGFDVDHAMTSGNTNSKNNSNSNSNSSSNNNNNSSGNGLSTKMSMKVVTPGVARAAKNAQSDLKVFDAEDDEMKDIEDTFDTYETPSGVEGGALQFSGLDLNKGMIEIKNMSEEDIQLDGYSLTNQNGDMQYPLPQEMTLGAKNTLRIYVGEELFKDMCPDDDDDDASVAEDTQEDADRKMKFIGDYDGAFVFWGNDVWTGTEKDCARLYNPNNVEIARIQISPDMIDGAISKKNCLMM